MLIFLTYAAKTRVKIRFLAYAAKTLVATIVAPIVATSHSPAIVWPKIRFVSQSSVSTEHSDFRHRPAIL